MIKYILTLLLLCTLIGSQAQDIKPSALVNRINSPSFYYYPADSSVWMYKSSAYQWTKLAQKKEIDSLGRVIGGTWGGKEPAIASGSAGQWWRYDKTWHSLSSADVGLSNVTNNAQWYSSNHPTTLSGYGITDTPWTSMGYLVSGGVLGTPSAGTLTNCTFPILNQNTTGSAATLTTARTIAGTSFNGSANITLANKFIVQGTTDAGLSGPQYLGALSSGILKNTTSTGVLSIATAGTDYLTPTGSAATLTGFPILNQNTTGTAANITGSTNSTLTSITALTSVGTLTGLSVTGTTDYPVKIKGSSGGGLLIGDISSSPASGGLWPALTYLGTALTPTASNYALMVQALGEVQLNATAYGIDLAQNGVAQFGLTNLGGIYLGSSYSNLLNNNSLPAGTMVISNKIGIGLGLVGGTNSAPVVPTASLHIAGSAGGTSGTAPLKINSGTLLTTPEPGVIENDGTALYYTDNTSARQPLSPPNNHHHLYTAYCAGSVYLADMTGLSVSHTPKGSSVFIMFTNQTINTGSAVNIHYYINVGTNTPGSATLYLASANPPQQAVCQAWYPVTAGIPITIKMTWNSSATVTANSNYLTIIDLP